MSGMEHGVWWLVVILILLFVIFVHFFRAERKYEAQKRWRDGAVRDVLDEVWNEAVLFDQERE